MHGVYNSRKMPLLCENIAALFHSKLILRRERKKTIFIYFQQLADGLMQSGWNLPPTIAKIKRLLSFVFSHSLFGRKHLTALCLPPCEPNLHNFYASPIPVPGRTHTHTQYGSVRGRELRSSATATHHRVPIVLKKWEIDCLIEVMTFSPGVFFQPIENRTDHVWKIWCGPKPVYTQTDYKTHNNYTMRRFQGLAQ